MDDARPAWADDDWLSLLLGVDHLARTTVATFEATAWSAPPVAEAPPADDLVLVLLGMDHLARRLVELGDRCADAAPATPATPPVVPGGLLR